VTSIAAPRRARLPADPRVRAALVVAAALVVFAAVLEVVARLTPSPHGPTSSSFATSSTGMAAYASLLDHNGVAVSRLTAPIAARTPARGATLVILDPDVVEPGEAAAIGRWVRAGGRLLAGGASDASWLDGVLSHPPQWRPVEPETAHPLVPVADTVGVRSVVARDGGGWRRLGATLPILGPKDAPLAVIARDGHGSVVLLADASPLQNRALGVADNAAFGLNLAAGRPVAFLETVHGYGVRRGLKALPDEVKWSLLGLLLAGLLALWTAGRRLGPAEQDDTPPPPARIEYVEALAAALARTKRKDEK
jgi:hypothetical protein